MEISQNFVAFSEYMNFKQLGRDLGPFFWQWKKVKLLSDIKPPLEPTYGNRFKGPILHPNLRGG